MNTFNVNDRVNRNEDREVTGATIIAIDGDFCELAYDEGGTGWWPYTEITLISAE